MIGYNIEYKNYLYNNEFFQVYRYLFIFYKKKIKMVKKKFNKFKLIVSKFIFDIKCFYFQ